MRHFGFCSGRRAIFSTWSNAGFGGENGRWYDIDMYLRRRVAHDAAAMYPRGKLHVLDSRHAVPLLQVWGSAMTFSGVFCSRTPKSGVEGFINAHDEHNLQRAYRASGTFFFVFTTGAIMGRSYKKNPKHATRVATTQSTFFWFSSLAFFVVPRCSEWMMTILKLLISENAHDEVERQGQYPRLLDIAFPVWLTFYRWPPPPIHIQLLRIIQYNTCTCTCTHIRHTYVVRKRTAGTNNRLLPIPNKIPNNSRNSSVRWGYTPRPR
ncbi:hypothetical protein EDD16DRAFT_168422 [Pisolithus croceorrhizus]|nr:hypothetical protein EDD16DRAFT_168422 [Pisolithus croceorrhizus]